MDWRMGGQIGWLDMIPKNEKMKEWNIEINA